ncbi:hypothetical protein BDZ94DRAFT_698083 [Collybia nuda]|uniref:Uncharacterized protein n=1 Tax=Collybia nuda TaxID=64659 RepID=A0A9P5Y6X9_9AGAR|nr:hypothetical protein BDZ94DRAFT_698083 [Collybia nuda]
MLCSQQPTTSKHYSTRRDLMFNKLSTHTPPQPPMATRCPPPTKLNSLHPHQTSDPQTPLSVDIRIFLPWKSPNPTRYIIFVLHASSYFRIRRLYFFSAW